MKRLFNIFRQQDGFTLMELMVVTGLLSLLLGAAYFFLQHTMLSTQQAYVQTDNLDNLRIAINRMSREVREATSIKINGDGYLEMMIGNNTIIYEFDANGEEIERNNMPVASHIKSLKISIEDCSTGNPNDNTDHDNNGNNGNHYGNDKGNNGKHNGDDDGDDNDDDNGNGNFNDNDNGNGGTNLKIVVITVEGPNDLKIRTAVTPRNNPQIIISD